MYSIRLIPFYLLCIIFCCKPAYAQRVISSQPVEDLPSIAYAKIIILKNGNTCYISYCGDGAINFWSYTKDQIQKVKKRISTPYWNPWSYRTFSVRALFEIEGELVLFFQQSIDDKPVLHRMRINSDNGEVIGEDLIAKTNTSYTLRYQKTEDYIYVDKDPQSDCYAVTFYDFEEPWKEELKVLHYNGKHVLLNAAHVTPVEGKHVEVKDVAVMGSTAVFVVSRIKSGRYQTDGKLYLSRLSKGEQAFVHKGLDYSDDFSDIQARLCFNSASGNLQLLTTSFKKNESSGSAYVYKKLYLCLLAYIHPETMLVTGITELSNDKIEKAGMQIYSDDVLFSGIPVDMVIGKNSNTVLLKEEIALTVAHSSLGNIGISQINAKGEDLNSYFLRRETHSTVDGGTMFLKNWDKNIWEPALAVKFDECTYHRPFSFIPGKQNDYIIYNNLKKRIEIDSDAPLKKRHIRSDKQQGVIYCVRNGAQQFTYLFGKPQRNGDYARFVTSSSASSESGVMAVVIQEKRKRKKTTKLVWFELE